MEERSHIGASSVQFVNDLVKDVCLKGKSLKNYRSDVGRFFPGNGDIYGQIEEFVDAFASAKSGKTEVDAAFLELRTLAQHIYLTSDTVNAVVEPLRSLVQKPEPVVVKQGTTSITTQKPKAQVPAKKGKSKKMLYIVLFLIVVAVLLILYFNSK